MTNYGVMTDYEWTGKRSRITVWSGSFMEEYVAEGLELPKKAGYMLTMKSGKKVRVKCPAPRTDDNYQDVDRAVNNALNALEAEEG